MSVDFRLVTLPHNNAELHGLLAVPHEQAAPVAIHVHGTWGNFYGNPFINALAECYGRHGIGFLTANFPGHDETAVSEDFDDFTPALDAWIGAYAGEAPLLLQGHSLGALKALRYLSDSRATNRERIRSLVLLSPFDIVAFYARGHVDEVDSRLARLDALIASAGRDAIAPSEWFDMWLITYGTLRALSTPGSPADQFDSRTQLPISPVRRLHVPTFIGIGGEDFAQYPTPKDVARMTAGLPMVTSALIEGAPHNFAGSVDRLVREVDAWLGSQSTLA